MSRFSLLLILLLVICGTARAEGLTPESMISFADSLFERGDYYRAITEYERVIFYYPDHPLALTARFQIANSYFKGERFEQALELFRSLSREYPNDVIGRKAYYLVGETYYQKHDYIRAADVFELFIDTYPDDPQADAARVRIGWSHLRQGKWQEASADFGKVPPGSPLRPQAESLTAGAEQYPGLPTKSPTLAGGLSAVLPGAGQLYIDRPGDALVSFLLNGAFIWGAVEAFRNDNETTGGILLFFESGWSLGNIYNATSGAHKYNRRGTREFLDGLQSRFSIACSRGGSQVLFSLRF
jgi:tetratricopeptide (TPR) repeat protein